jgi:hypothetical protein
MTDQQLADAVHEATRALSRAFCAARDAGLEVSVDSFFRGDVGNLVAHVSRVIPAKVTHYEPTNRE